MPIVNKKFYAAGALAMAAPGAEALCTNLNNKVGDTPASGTLSGTVGTPDFDTLSVNGLVSVGTLSVRTGQAVHAHGKATMTCNHSGATNTFYVPKVEGVGLYHGDKLFMTTAAATAVKPTWDFQCGKDEDLSTGPPFNSYWAVAGTFTGEPKIVSRGTSTDHLITKSTTGDGVTAATTTATQLVANGGADYLECTPLTAITPEAGFSRREIGANMQVTCGADAGGKPVLTWVDSTGIPHCFTATTDADDTTPVPASLAALVCSKSDFASAAAGNSKNSLTTHYNATIRSYDNYRLSNADGSLLACRQATDSSGIKAFNGLAKPMATADLAMYNAAVKRECGEGAFFISAEAATDAECRACPATLGSCANGDLTCNEGYYQDLTTTNTTGNPCVVCPAGAKVCSGATTHTECKPGYTLNGGTTCVEGVDIISNADTGATGAALADRAKTPDTGSAVTLQERNAECLPGFYESHRWNVDDAMDAEKQNFRCAVCPLEKCDKVEYVSARPAAEIVANSADYFFGACKDGRTPTDATNDANTLIKVWTLKDKVSENETDGVTANTAKGRQEDALTADNGVFKCEAGEWTTVGSTRVLDKVAACSGAETNTTGDELMPFKTKQRYQNAAGQFIGCRETTKQRKVADPVTTPQSNYTGNHMECLPGYKAETPDYVSEAATGSNVKYHLVCKEMTTGDATCTKWGQTGCMQATCPLAKPHKKMDLAGNIVGCHAEPYCPVTTAAEAALATTHADVLAHCGYNTAFKCLDTTKASKCECDAVLDYKAKTGVCTDAHTVLDTSVVANKNKTCDAESAAVGSVAAMDTDMCVPCERSVVKVHETVSNVATMKTQCAAADLVNLEVKIDTELTAANYTKLTALLAAAPNSGSFKVQQVPLITITNLGAQTAVSGSTSKFTSSVTMKMERSLANTMTGALALPKIVKALKAAIAAADVATLPQTDKDAMTTKVTAATANATPIASWPGLPTCTSVPGSGCTNEASPTTCTAGGHCSAGGAGGDTCTAASLATEFSDATKTNAMMTAWETSYKALQAKDDKTEANAMKATFEGVCDKLEEKKLCTAPASSSAFGTKPALLTALVAGVAALFF